MTHPGQHRIHCTVRNKMTLHVSKPLFPIEDFRKESRRCSRTTASPKTIIILSWSQMRIPLLHPMSLKRATSIHQSSEYIGSAPFYVNNKATRCTACMLPA